MSTTIMPPAPPAPPRKRHTVRWVILGSILLLVLVSCLGAIASTVVEPPEPTAPAPAEPKDKAEPKEAEPRPEPKADKKEAPVETTSQANARKAAEDYIAFAPFSRKGLVEQLVFEGYPTADAEYGVDALHADWNEQAARAAKDYLSYQAFSRQGLIEQLMFEGYTRAQATHGANEAGL